MKRAGVRVGTGTRFLYDGALVRTNANRAMTAG